MYDELKISSHLSASHKINLKFISKFTLIFVKYFHKRLSCYFFRRYALLVLTINLGGSVGYKFQITPHTRGQLINIY